MAVVLAIDAGTTGVRAFAVGDDARPRGYAYREFTQHFPQPGWVEHDAEEIWQAVGATLAELVAALDGEPVAAIGITNQRETVVAWDRTSGRPLHRAIVWQDRRTAARCAELDAAGVLPLVRARTGLVLDPYFSGTKMAWLLGEGGVAVTPSLALGTVDDWLLWKLTGVHATEASNASRTMCFDIVERAWSDELCALLGVPRAALGEVLPSVGRMATVRPDALGGTLAGVPVSAMLGDQQAALFGQACVQPGMAKCTYGTGSFVLADVGPACPAPVDGLLTTIAWDLGAHAPAGESVHYALEGAVFVTGAAIQWLRDGLGLIADASEIGPLAESVASADGVMVVPAFTGLGSPWWDPYARGTIVGITRGTGRAQLARAVVESMALQVRDVVDAMAAASGRTLTELRVDGGASVMDVLCRLQADQLGVTVRRPEITETTALGAALAAGLAEGVWGSVDGVGRAWHEEASFAPDPVARGAADALHAQWTRAVERSRHWAAP